MIRCNYFSIPFVPTLLKTNFMLQEHAKEATKMRQEFDQNAKELQQKSDRKVSPSKL